MLLDDRKSSPGVKFADAELIGVPTIVVVGRGLANGVIEVIYYVVAGLGWVLPAMPLIAWMSRPDVA